MTNSPTATGDSNSPAPSGPATFSDIIGTGYFPGNVEGGEVTVSTAGDLNLPENRPCTFAEIIGTGYFRRQLCTGNVNDDEVTSSTVGDLNPQEPARPSTLCTGNVDDDEARFNTTSSRGGDLNSPEPVRPSTSSEVNGTGNFRRLFCTGNLDDDDSFHYDDNFLQQFSTWIESVCLQIKNDGKKKVAIMPSSAAGKRLNDFPPLLTSLNRNGRPRFNLEKVRDGERLVIRMVPNDWPEVVRSPQGNGRVKMMLVVDGAVDDNYDADDDEDEDEDDDLNSNGKSAGNGLNDQF